MSEGEERIERWRKASFALGAWMSAALDDPKVCEQMKADINEWFSAGEPFVCTPPPIAPSAIDASKYADMGIDEKAKAMADDCVGDPWELLGYFREKLRQAEWEGDYARTAALKLAQKLAALAPPPIADQATGAVREAAQPWADYHGDLPDYDHPLRCVFESGVQYVVELLAKELNVSDWTPCDGTEEFDGDLGGTLMNIVRASLPKDEHGEHLWPCEVSALLQPKEAAE